MKGEEEEKSAFRRSSKVARSPVGPTGSGQGESGSEHEVSGSKRKERPGKTPEKVMEKRSRRSPAKGAEETETESEDIGITEEEFFGGGEIGEIWRVSSEIKQWLANQFKTRKISLVAYDEMTSKIKKVRQLSFEMTKKISKLEGRLEERVKFEEVMEEKLEKLHTVPTKKTFAEVVGIPKITGVKKVTPSPKVVMIHSTEEKEAEEVKKIVKNVIQPREAGINVRRVRKTARGLMVEMENEEQVRKLEENRDLIGKGLVIERMKKRNPRIMIYDIENEDKEEEVIQNIYDQNLRQTDITYEEMNNDFRCVHKYKSRSDPNKSHWVVECTAKIRNEVRKKERIYVGWQCCRIKDYNPVVRCYQCQAFGHVAKFCRNKVVCPHCACEHDRQRCPNKERPGICVNCKFSGKTFDHVTGDRGCPEVERATRLALERIDYGH